MLVGSTVLIYYQHIRQLCKYTLIWGRADLPAIHDGHVAVHEDQIVLRGVGDGHRLLRPMPRVTLGAWCDLKGGREREMTGYEPFTVHAPTQWAISIAHAVGYRGL